KIAEVDTLLTVNRHCGVEVREIHPEVCFWALAGGRPMLQKKKSATGIAERLQVLVRYERSAEQFLRSALAHTRRTQVMADDVLDALVALLTAEMPDYRLSRLAGSPGVDQCGLPMEMMHVAC